MPLPASSADVSYQLQETFASEEVGGTRGSVEDWDGFPLPPNHKVSSLFSLLSPSLPLTLHLPVLAHGLRVWAGCGAHGGEVREVCGGGS